jgi:hypothetical protein
MHEKNKIKIQTLKDAIAIHYQFFTVHKNDEQQKIGLVIIKCNET